MPREDEIFTNSLSIVSTLNGLARMTKPFALKCRRRKRPCVWFLAALCAGHFGGNPAGETTAARQLEFFKSRFAAQHKRAQTRSAQIKGARWQARTVLRSESCGPFVALGLMTKQRVVFCSPYP